MMKRDQQGIDIVALSWCIPEIRESLARARPPNSTGI